MINRISFAFTSLNRIKKQSPSDKKTKENQVETKSEPVLYNCSYVLNPLIYRRDYTENEKNYLTFKRQLSKKFHVLETIENRAEWDFNINSTDENEKIYNEAKNNRLKLASDKDVYSKLTELDEKKIDDPILQLSLNKLIKRYKNKILNVDIIKELDKSVNMISKKFNAYRGEIEGEEYPNIDLDKMMETEMDTSKRKEIYQARRVFNGDLIADDLVNLVKERNKFAQTKGYKDYYSYKLAETYEVDKDKLFSLLDDLGSKTEKIYNKFNSEDDEKLADAFGIEVKDLRPWHYGLVLENNPVGKVDKHIKDNDAMVSQSMSMYKKMGWDISKLPITLDLFPKPNKNQHGFCFDIDTNKDVRILANLTNDTSSLQTLNHELGHAVYDLGISDHLSYFDREPASSAMTEAVAVLMETLPIKEKSFVESMGISDSLAEQMKQATQKESITFIRKCLVFLNFEKSMYENPDQDLPKLWYNLEKKYMNRNIPEELDNRWATIPHFTTHPAYYQNYLRAELMSAQIYESAKKKLGPLTQNTNTAEYFRTKLFRYGASEKENELIKRMTGKPLSPEAFVNQFKDMDAD